MPRMITLIALAPAVLPAAGCGSGAEAVEVELPVLVSSARIEPAENDLGWTVTVSELRAAIRDVQFTVEGEEHETGTVARRVGPPPPPHPGHAAGGDVTGELPGEFVLDWMDDGAELGTATLLTGDYHGANFAFRSATEADGLEPGDPLLGHSFHLVGRAEKDGVAIDLDVALAIDEETELVGAPFELEVSETTEASIGLEIATIDPFEDDTLFDGLDWGALDDDGDGAVEVRPDQESHNRLRRLFQAHDYYYATPRQ
jgi:hypothetical protein